jgi:hypothetical protein
MLPIDGRNHGTLVYVITLVELGHTRRSRLNKMLYLAQAVLRWHSGSGLTVGELERAHLMEVIETQVFRREGKIDF